MAVGKNITRKKGKGEAVLSSLYGFWEEYQVGKGTEILGKGNQDLKKWGGEEYQVAGHFIHPCNRMFFNLSAFIRTEFTLRPLPLSSHKAGSSYSQRRTDPRAATI